MHDIFREPAHKTRMVKRFSPTTSASASDRLMESARRKLSFASDATDKGLAYWRGEGLRPSPFVSPPDEAPYARLGFEEPDEDCKGEMEDVMDVGQKIWRDMKVRKYCFRGRGSIMRVKFLLEY